MREKLLKHQNFRYKMMFVMAKIIPQNKNPEINKGNSTSDVK